MSVDPTTEHLEVLRHMLGITDATDRDREGIRLNPRI